LTLEENEIINEIIKELNRAEIVHQWFDDYIHCASVVCEEAGELIRATLDHKYGDMELKQYNKELMKKEAIHTAATAIRFLKNL
jgi:hypothetical protein